LRMDTTAEFPQFFATLQTPQAPTATPTFLDRALANWWQRNQRPCEQQVGFATLRNE